jgi:DNA-binding HxlR family transcriptional regulator
VLPIGEFILTPRQNRVLDVLKRLNLAGISNAHINNKSVVDILSTIANSTSAWMSREKVFETLNKEGGEYMSLSTVNNELQYLLKAGIVDRKKPPKTNQYKYYILTLDAGQYLALPHPSEIKDPIYQGKPVEVVNPLTDAVEKI